MLGDNEISCSREYGSRLGPEDVAESFSIVHFYRVSLSVLSGVIRPVYTEAQCTFLCLILYDLIWGVWRVISITDIAQLAQTKWMLQHNTLIMQSNLQVLYFVHNLLQSVTENH